MTDPVSKSRSGEMAESVKCLAHKCETRHFDPPELLFKKKNLGKLPSSLSDGERDRWGAGSSLTISLTFFLKDVFLLIL